MTLAELQQIAFGLTGARFVREVGPFVLLQHTPGAPLLGGEERRRTAHISRRAMIMKSAEAKSDLGELEVVLLPPMAQGAMLKIGRAPDNDLIIEDASASKHHAILAWTNGQGRLSDLGSRNGTAVDGEALEPNGEKPLRDGAVLSFGGAQFVYYTAPRMFDILGGGSG